jgi:hypothetical protein
MDASRAQELLDLAEKMDGYLAACKASEVNRKARVFFQNHAWSDQSGAPSVKGATVVILPASAEGGMPHTRAGNIICIPVYHPKEKLPETLAHELIHIDQRNRPGVWRKRLLEEGWSPVEESELPFDWVRRCRLNPDTIAARWWAWEGRYVPLPVFVREDKPDLRDIQVRWYDRQEKRVGTQIPMTLSRRYGELGISSLEHPYELHAYSKTK